MKLIKQILCLLIAFQLTGCAQAVIQQRQEKNAKLGENYAALEAECNEQSPKEKIKTVEAFVLCMQEKALPMLEEEGFEDCDVIERSYSEQLQTIEDHKKKKLSSKKLKKRIESIEQNTAVELNAREAGRVQADYQREEAVKNVMAVALIGTAVYYGAKNGAFSGGNSSYAPRNNLQGCCSWHGGVDACYSPRVLCNDGTYSPTCTC